MPKAPSNEFTQIHGLIMNGQLADAASGIEFSTIAEEQETLVAYLLDALCNRGDSKLVRRVYDRFLPEKLPNELLVKIHALAVAEEDDGFQSYLPTAVR